MFSVATTKGRLASLALVLLAFTMVACPGVDTPLVDGDGYYVNADSQYVDGNGDLLEDGFAMDADSGELVDVSSMDDGATAADCETGTECDDTGDPDCTGDTCGEPDFTGLGYDYSFASCHEQSTAGGASDGVISGTIPEAPEGAVVTLSLTYDDGTQSEAMATVGPGGELTFVFALHSFGEQITVTGATIEGETLDLSGAELELTVSPESDCSTHPNS